MDSNLQNANEVLTFSILNGLLSLDKQWKNQEANIICHIQE